MLLTEYDEVATMELFKAEGREEGQNKLGLLITKLRSLGRENDAFEAAADPVYREKLYQEFQIA